MPKIAFKTSGGRIMVHESEVTKTNEHGQPVQVPNPIIAKMAAKDKSYSLATYNDIVEWVTEYNKNPNLPASKKLNLESTLNELGLKEPAPADNLEDVKAKLAAAEAENDKLKAENLPVEPVEGQTEKEPETVKAENTAKPKAFGNTEKVVVKE